jgi:hypothetical protein
MQTMLLPILLSLSGLVRLVLLASTAYVVWTAHQMTVQERLSGFELPSQVAWAGRVFFKADFSEVQPVQGVKDLAQPILF